MPLYDYRCSGCQRTFESLLDRWNAPAPPCPHCGAAGAARQPSVFAVASVSGDASRPCDEQGECGTSSCACKFSPN
jgi:putative FmdB family regulatory protein